MEQLKAIKVISEAIKKDKNVRSMFLKGSLARNEMDSYSDVDFYCLVKSDSLEEFLKKRLHYLKQYRPLIYWSEVNFVGPQIVAVFDNGLHFDLYTVTHDTLSMTDEIKIIYDPENLLDNYKAEKLAISEKEFLRYFNSFAFTMLEFETAYLRKDLIWASRLTNHLSADLAAILRYFYDRDNSKLGFKRLHEKLDKNLREKLIKAMDFSGPSYLPEGAIMLAEILREIIEMHLNETLKSKVNIEFFYFMFERFKKL
ncbi:aminoglycoside 6-adenylyltransferase [Thermosipho ferrireducens]|uniref:Aminoglycoside 6-adenylyltransferase n=1 Tax=Thermosipho ferrireducens TaxID=2571116 RepID=A0ABX7S6S8_9BACT|nr:aminoglycoside 6-adenylyltransferase [Thermosipho ferrireducens]QTA37904.1 aminoglycoside 6-adenylyltransferase [Thermosipho ferrireducens]